MVGPQPSKLLTRVRIPAGACLKKMEEHTELKKNWHDKHYKLLLVIPATILILSLLFLFNFYVNTGDWINRDISLKGGTSVTVYTETNIQELESFLEERFEDFSIREISDLRTREQEAVVIEVSAETEEVKSALEQYYDFELTEKNSSIEFTGASLSENFYKQLILAILFAFTFMAIVVFFIFGKGKWLKTLLIALAFLTPFLFFVTGTLTMNSALLLSLSVLLFSLLVYIRYSIPSFAVVLSAFADIAMTLALVNLLGIKLSSAGIVAFLMLIGYSVDSDILLTTKILKRRDEALNTRIVSAFKTGITMTLTSLAAVLISLFIVMSLSNVLTQIFTILAIGLGFDLINTWLSNLSILKWYAHKRGIE